MTEKNPLLKEALVEELHNGRFQLVQAGSSRIPVSKIEFNNRKAARNWGKSRGFVISADLAPDGTTLHGPN